MTSCYKRSAECDLALRNTLFVIPSINGGELLGRMLPSIKFPCNSVLIVDQGSSDSTQQVCASHGVEILSLDSAISYTRACNIGIKIARERGCEYVILANNDIVFVNDVAGLLMSECLADPNLAIIAPSQQLIDRDGVRHTAYRVKWDLSNLVFMHDFDAPSVDKARVESDFCELTCALIRLSALNQVGDLDDEYGFYHEDADLCFRFREHGYSCAYLPSAQIIHYHGSTMLNEGIERRSFYIAKNKKLFSRKHGGLGVNHSDHRSTATNSWNIINRYLNRYLWAYGLIDFDRPELLFSHPGVEPYDYLFTVWETSSLPREWRNYTESYRGVFTTSRWCLDVLEQCGFSDSKLVPLGVETDIFHSEGPFERLFEEKTFLWFANNQYRKGLDVMLAAWQIFIKSYPKARLVLVGTNLSIYLKICTPPRIWRGASIYELEEQRIFVMELFTPLAEMELAALYRSVDVCVVTSRSEGFGFVVAEAMATGKPVVFPEYSGCAEFIFEGALSFKGTPRVADYSDKGFSQVGSWWEPDIEDLVRRLKEAYNLRNQELMSLSKASVLHIRRGYTWRNTCFYLRSALAALQEPKASRLSRLVKIPANIETTEDFAKKIDDEIKTKSRDSKDSSAFLGFEGFDSEFYAAANPDVVAEGFSPFQHFIEYGWKEDNRSPSPYFSTRQLIASNSDARRFLIQRNAVTGSAPRKNGLTEKIRAVPQFFQKIRASRIEKSKELPLFVGYVEAALGLGESTRGMLHALDAIGLDFAIYPFNKDVETRLIGSFMPARYDLTGAHEINIFEVGADQLLFAVDALDKSSLLKSYNILRAYCELPRAPDNWKPVLSLMRELWVPTQFVAESFSHIFSGPIKVVPPHVDVGVGAKDSFDRAHFGLDDNNFYFIFTFDYYSTVARKNPLGTIEAFFRAFSDKLELPIALIIKSVGPSDLDPSLKAAIDRAVSTGRVVLFDNFMTREEFISLLNCADCYVSLHRSEGFGLGMAESMALAKPVIGTAYSGNVDFLTDATGYPVPFKLRKVRDGEYYSADRQVWAEPDITAAADIMQFVYSNREDRHQKACAAKELINSLYGPENVGKTVQERFQKIRQL